MKELHEELRKVARDLLAASGGAGNPADVDWDLVAGLGWLGLEVPEALGGSGASFAEVAVVAEELARVASAGPFLGSVVLGVGLLRDIEPGAGRDALLAGIAGGSDVVAVVVPTGDDAVAVPAPSPAFRLTPGEAGLVLDGAAPFVPDAPDAGTLLVVAADPDGAPVVVVARPTSPGIEVTAVPVVDPSHALGAVSATAAPVADGDIWRFDGDPHLAFARLLQRGALGVAVDCLGVAGAMLDATVAYAGVRHQFGRPIGSFQAVKHMCADMLVQLSLSRELVALAIGHLVDDHPDAATSSSMAKAHAGAMAVAVAGAAMQLHGGIGYTWESGVHLHLKRATLDRSLFGSPKAHRAALARRYSSDSAMPRPGAA